MLGDNYTVVDLHEAREQAHTMGIGRRDLPGRLPLDALPVELIRVILTHVACSASGLVDFASFRGSSRRYRCLGSQAEVLHLVVSASRVWHRCGAVINAGSGPFACFQRCGMCLDRLSSLSPLSAGYFFPRAVSYARLEAVRTEFAAGCRLCEQHITQMLALSRIASEDQTFCCAFDVCTDAGASPFFLCALWPTRHGPRWWVRTISSSGRSTDTDIVEARTCLLGAHDVTGWIALKPDSGNRQDLNGTALSLSVDEWQHLEKWLIAPGGGLDDELVQHVAPAAVRGSFGTQLEARVRQALIGHAKVLNAGNCMLLLRMRFVALPNDPQLPAHISDSNKSWKSTTPSLERLPSSSLIAVHVPSGRWQAFGGGTETSSSMSHQASMTPSSEATV
jgi:hypothetical protein